MAQKKMVADITGPRYRKAGKAKKTLIPDEFCHTTGYNRKYAITLLRHAGKTQVRRWGKGQDHRPRTQETSLSEILR
jgi:hypothetical protein